MKIRIESESDMRILGERLGRALKGGECLELVGDVGAGKTTLTKGIAVGLGIEDTVQSPTFTINRSYEGRDGLRLSHYDFYRLQDPGIMAQELAESLDDTSAVIVIEWGDVVASVMPEDHLRIDIGSPDEATRELHMRAKGKKAMSLLEELS